jgi:hypothetical protein
VYAIEHKLKDYSMMKNIMISRSLTRATVLLGFKTKLNTHSMCA